MAVKGDVYMLIEYCRGFNKKVHLLIIFPISHSDQELLCQFSDFQAAFSTCYSLSSMILTSSSLFHSLEMSVFTSLKKTDKVSPGFCALCRLSLPSSITVKLFRGSIHAHCLHSALLSHTPAPARHPLPSQTVW